MLSNIYIQGLAVIDELRIDFSPQLNVITGETGAGKSILIKALNLILGGKGSSDVVRKGSKRATVSAVFALPPSHPVFKSFEEHGLEIAADGEIILRRQITAKGRSQSWVNDFPVTLMVLKSIGIHLVDIFGQHDNHKLLDSSQHCQYLDQFLAKKDLKIVYKSKFLETQAVLKGLKRDFLSFENRLRERDYLEFRKAELEKLSPSVEDYNELKDFIEGSRESFARNKAFREVECLVDQGFGGRPLSQAFHEIVCHLKGLPESEGLLDKAHSLEEDLNQYSYELGKELSKSDVSQEQIHEVEDRLDNYHQMFAKLNVKDIEGLCDKFKNMQEELTELDRFACAVDTRLLQLGDSLQDLMKSGAALTKARKIAFKNIQSQIQGELAQLNMKGASLFLDMKGHEGSSLEPTWSFLSESQNRQWASILESMSRCNSEGLERVQFLLRSNPGDEAKELSKIASGGEVSRIMLGIKKVLSQGAQTCVMVFDEIDTGISGETATIVGGKLFDIAAKFQVICISHLPQVAVYGKSHFKVTKTIIGGRAESKIEKMSKKQSIEEVARLLSSGKITESSLRNARELFSEVKGLK